MGLPPLRGHRRRRSRRRSAWSRPPAPWTSQGVEIAPEDLEALLRVDTAEWRAELPSIREHLATFGDQLPPALLRQLDALADRLDS